MCSQHALHSNAFLVVSVSVRNSKGILEIIPKFGESGSEMSSRKRSECSKLRCVKPILTGNTVSLGARDCLVHATGAASRFSWRTCEPSGELTASPLKLRYNRLETRIFRNFARTRAYRTNSLGSGQQHFVVDSKWLRWHCSHSTLRNDGSICKAVVWTGQVMLRPAFCSLAMNVVPFVLRARATILACLPIASQCTLVRLNDQRPEAWLFLAWKLGGIGKAYFAR